jgi:hypothetical protein
MKDKESLHKKVQEHIDCFATTDPLAEMSALEKDADKESAALKWLALTALHGVNNGAKKIKIQKSGDGTIKVTAKYREKELPNPGAEVSEKVFETIRGITHIEDDEGKTDLALGIRDSSIGVKVKVKKDDDGETVSIKFPE